MPKKSTAGTRQTRRDILAKAVDLASVEGLEGVTIGRLASATFLSKSGLFAHFGSKEELQLAVVDSAREIFEGEVLAAAAAVEAGLPRLVELGEAWLRYVEKGLFRGGCFFAAVSLEVDDRPGRVRETVAKLGRSWLQALEAEAALAIAAGHLTGQADPAQIAFEIHAFVQEANWAFQLHGDGDTFRRAALAMHRTIDAAATPDGRALIGSGGNTR